MADRFNTALIAVVSLTVLCGVAMIALALLGPSPQTGAVATVFETLKLSFMMGLTTVFGLLAVRPRKEPDPD